MCFEWIITLAYYRHNAKIQFSSIFMGQLMSPPVKTESRDNPSRRATGAGRSIYDLLRTQITDGTLPPGAKAPSTRGMAAEMGVSRTTVTAAYEQLAAEGYLLTSTGRAAIVANPITRPAAPRRPQGRHAISAPRLSDFAHRMLQNGLPALAHITAAKFDFLYGAVASRDFPTLAWRRAYQAELLQQQQRLYYAPPEGDASLRKEVQGYLRRARGLSCDAEQILVVHGSQQGIDLCARLLLNAGDAFVFEDPGYLMARRCFEATGAQCLPIPVDAHGMDTSLLPKVSNVRLAYVTPSHQFPLGGVLPITRRQELLHWAQNQDAWIVEDDYDGEFRYGQRPIDALQSIDNEGRVIYVGTFSKTLSPQLRIGYLVLPTELVASFRQAKRMTDRHAPVLEQRALASLIQSGAYERHVRRTRRENERRRLALLEAVANHLPKDIQVGGSAAGLHVVLWLPFLRPEEEPALVMAARQVGVGIYPVSSLFASDYSSAPPRPAGFILGYASLTVSQIQQGIQVLNEAISRPEKPC